MNRNEEIRHLTELLEDAASHLNYSVQRDGTPDEVYMGDVESLTAAIRALNLQGAAEPEQPKSREGKMLDKILSILASKAYDSDRPMFEAVAQLWRNGERARSQLERIALDGCRQKWQWDVSPNNLNGKREIICRVGLLLLDYVNPDCATDEDDANDQN